ncbi:MAG: DUF4214 domain-containing protein [Pseudomonadota bacterium]
MAVITGTEFDDDGFAIGNAQPQLFALVGTSEDDLISGLAGDDILIGEAGADTLDGGTGFDDLAGGSGNDSLNGGPNGDFLRGGPGDDTLEGGDIDSDLREDWDTALFDDALTGLVIDLSQDVVTVSDGQGGTDLLIDIEGAVGGAFDDVMITAPVFEAYLDGGAGDDQLIAVSETAVVYFIGGDGNDVLDATDANSQSGGFRPGQGNDTVRGSVDSDFSFLGINNVLSYLEDAAIDGATAGIRATYSSEFDGTIIDYSGGTDTFSGIRVLQGTPFADTLTGAGGDQSFIGNGGDDIFDGGAGSGDAVSYQRFGWTLRDDVFRDPNQTGVTVDLITGVASDGYGGTDTLINIEDVEGSAYADTLLGDDGDNRLFGNAGDDLLRGRGGDDEIIGFLGNETLDGGPGDDILNGSLGNDTYVMAPQGGEDKIFNDFGSFQGLTLDLTAFARGDAMQAIANVSYSVVENPENFARVDVALFEFADGTALTWEKLTPDLLPDLTILLNDDNAAPTGTIGILGEARAGSTVRVDLSAFADADIILADTLTYQWERDGFAIAGATSDSYALTTEDVAAAIGVRVTYSDGAGLSETAASSEITPLSARLNLSGGDADESLSGGAADEVLSALGGDDTLVGSAGDDILDGGTGIDTVQYSGPQSSYTLTITADGLTVQDRRPDGTGTDVLRGIEFLDFDVDLLPDGFDLRDFGGSAALPEDALLTVVELYIAYFNRAPDAVGLFFWATAFAEGLSLTEMSKLFVEQVETRVLYPDDLPNSAFVSTVYNNVLGRIPDQDGFNFWVNVLDQGNVGRDTFILNVLEGAKTEPAPGASQAFIDQQRVDRQYLADKTDLGAYFSVIQGMSDLDNASAAMAIFDGSQTSVDAAVAQMDVFFAAAQDPTDGEFLMPLVGVIDDPFVL